MARRNRASLNSRIPTPTKAAARRTAAALAWLDSLIAQASTNVLKIDPETGRIIHDAPAEIYRRAAMPA